MTTGYSTGYGRIYRRLPNGLYRCVGAHVLSLTIATGEDPNGRDCMHSCDNPICVNPAHLQWGTRTDNMQDASRKGRTRNKPFASGDDHPFRKSPELVKRGDRHQNSILTSDAVQRIYRLRLQGLTSKQIAPIVGISWQQVGFVISGKSWAHMLKEPGAPTLDQLKNAGPGNTRRHLFRATGTHS